MRDSFKQPCLYIPHGGGPCFFMDWDPPDTWIRMGNYLSGVSKTLDSLPDALIVISAHWESDPISITAIEFPDLIYDYYGFPEHTYQLKWPAPGAPVLAAKVLDLLSASGIQANLDSERGFDHGVFIPLKLMFPNATVPTIQISLHPSLDPSMHLVIGRALNSLRSRNVLIIGSGMSFHDVDTLMGRKPDEGSEDFDDWLNRAVLGNCKIRDRMLMYWEDAPNARSCHPREEHLLPLHVIVGAAGEDTGVLDYKDRILGVSISGFRFE